MEARATIRAVLAGLAAVAAFALPARAQTIERDGQRVEVQVASHPGGSTVVCLESAEGITGRKRLTVSWGGGSARLSTAGNDRGPHCASFEPRGSRFGVRLEYGHFVLLTAILADRSFGREEFRGKTLTFRWVAE